MSAEVTANCQTIGAPIYINLINHGGEKTKHYVEGLHRGKKLQIPIVNGYAPLITVQHYPNGVEVRTFDYGKRYVWNPSVVWKDTKETVKKSSEPLTSIPKISTIDETKKSSIFESKENVFYNFDETDRYLRKFSEIK